MKHPLLGTIKREGDDGEAAIIYQSRQIDMQIIADDHLFELSVSLAAKVVKHLSQYDDKAKQIIVNDLLSMYNAGWNEYDEVQEDESLKAVTNPKLTAEQFKNKLSLTAINITDNTVVELFYDDSGLFWGHTVLVSSLDSNDFRNARAELFG